MDHESRLSSRRTWSPPRSLAWSRWSSAKSTRADLKPETPIPPKLEKRFWRRPFASTKVRLSKDGL